MERIAVFGGRDFKDMQAVVDAMGRLLMKKGPFVMVHGACPTGADEFARIWGEMVLIPAGGRVEDHPADWARFGKSAGPRRNRVMATSGLAGAVGFPGGTGTRNMAKELEDAGIRIWWPRGSSRDLVVG